MSSLMECYNVQKCSIQTLCMSLITLVAFRRLGVREIMTYSTHSCVLHAGTVLMTGRQLFIIN